MRCAALLATSRRAEVKLVCGRSRARLPRNKSQRPIAVPRICAHLQRFPTSTHDHAQDASRDPFQRASRATTSRKPSRPLRLHSPLRFRRAAHRRGRLGLTLAPVNTASCAVSQRRPTAPALLRHAPAAAASLLPLRTRHCLCGCPDQVLFCRTARLQQHGQRVSVASCARQP